MSQRRRRDVEEAVDEDSDGTQSLSSGDTKDDDDEDSKSFEDKFENETFVIGSTSDVHRDQHISVPDVPVVLTTKAENKDPSSSEKKPVRQREKSKDPSQVPRSGLFFLHDERISKGNRYERYYYCNFLPFYSYCYSGNCQVIPVLVRGPRTMAVVGFTISLIHPIILI